MLVLEVKATLLSLTSLRKAVLWCAPGKVAMVRQAAQTAPLGRAVRPLAAGLSSVVRHEHHAIACHGCPSCGGPLTVRRPRTRTAFRHWLSTRKAGVPRAATHELHCQRTAVAHPLALSGAQLRACPGTNRAVHATAGVLPESRITEQAATGAPAMHLKATTAAPNPSFKRTATGVPVSAA
jgi:hypothetical protein